MPPKISHELIFLKPKSLGVAMSIAQDIFKAHNLGNINNSNINNITDEDRMNIDAINVNATYQRNPSSTNYQ
jgi:hypothetical protein